MKRNEALAILSQHLNTVQHRFGVKSLAIFGSVSRDEAGDNSDVDVLVEFEITPGLVRYMDLKFFLEDVLHRPVDIATPNSLKPRIRPRVLQEAVLVPRHQALPG